MSLSLAEGNLLVEVPAVAEKYFPDIGADEARAVAGELHQRRADAHRADLEAACRYDAPYPEGEHIYQKRHQHPLPEESTYYHCHRTEREQGRKPVHQLHRARIKQLQSDPRHSEDVHLTPELPEIHPALVVYPDVGEKSDLEAVEPDARAHVDILAEHLAETSGLLEHPPREAHVECARHKLLHACLSAPDAAGGKKRGHGVIYRLLRVGERLVGSVRTAEAVGGTQFEGLA